MSWSILWMYILLNINWHLSSPERKICLLVRIEMKNFSSLQKRCYSSENKRYTSAEHISFFQWWKILNLIRGWQSNKEMIPTGGLQFKKLKKRNFDAIWIPPSQNPSKSKTFRLLLCNPSARIIYLLQFVLGTIRIKHLVESTAIWVNWMILFVNCRIILTSY